MTRPFEHLAELKGLLDALCEESITAEQVRRLEQLVLSYPEAEAYYVQYMSLHADLSRAFSGLPVATARSLRDHLGPEPAGAAAGRPRAASRRRFLFWGSSLGLAGLAAGLLVAVALWPRAPAVVPPADDGAEADDDSVAVLLQAPGARWEPADVAPRAGSPLAPGWLRLKSGFAHIEFYSGATVILQGPAEFRLVSRTEAYCARGKLWAQVPPQAHGFTVGSPTLDLVDRGTEFGFEVGAGRRAEVHVFRGKVELYDPGADREAAPHKDLTTGQGMELDGRGAARPIKPDPSAFLTAQQLAARASSAAESRHHDWLAAGRELRRDTSLRVYFPFQAEQPWSRTLADQAGGRQDPCDGAIVGCSWVAGRWPGKQGLEFKRVSDRVRLHVPGEFDALTLVTWVRVDALPNRYSSLLMSDGWDGGCSHWHIRQDGKMTLGVKALGDQAVNYFTGVVFGPERLGQWTQLAVVYDRGGGDVTHYADGQMVKHLPMKLDVPLHIGDAEIGNWNAATSADKYPVRHLSGCMDEFLMFARALSPEEIERLYNQGRPSP
jgi:ferric-dicitrate binding protein FerR (iron transport regulator)